MCSLFLKIFSPVSEITATLPNFRSHCTQPCLHTVLSLPCKTSFLLFCLFPGELRPTDLPGWFPPELLPSWTSHCAAPLKKGVGVGNYLRSRSEVPTTPVAAKICQERIGYQTGSRKQGTRGNQQRGSSSSRNHLAVCPRASHLTSGGFSFLMVM